MPVKKSPPLTPHQAVGPVAFAVRIGDAEGEKVARRNLAEAKIRAAIQRELAKAPPLTPRQVTTLRRLLTGGGAQ